MRCSLGARIALIVSVGAMRLADQYIAAMLYRLCARRFEGRSAKTRKIAAFAFGQAMGLPQLIASLGMFMLIQGHTMRCNLTLFGPLDPDHPVAFI